MRNSNGFLLVGALAAGVTLLEANISTKEQHRIQEAATVIREIHATPDKDIPAGAVGRRRVCTCSSFPEKALRSLSEASDGKGLMSCRHMMGIGALRSSWRSEKEVGVCRSERSRSDLVLLVMNRSGMDKLRLATR